MERISNRLDKIQIRMVWTGRISLSLDFTWLIVLPAGLWLVSAYYVPIFGAFFTPLQAWAVTLTIALLAGACLACHIIAHQLVSNPERAGKPAGISLYVFGESAQNWPAAHSAGGEALAALAGSLANLLLAGLAYLAWNAQLNTFLNLVMLFLCGFNLWLAVINLIPAFPFDGGRLARALLWGLARQPALAARLPARMGYLAAGALTLWGVFLFAQQSRFSLETGSITLFFALLILAGLRRDHAWERDRRFLGNPDKRIRLLPLIVPFLAMLVLLGAASSLLLANNGLEAPGVALSVEPMVEVPAQYQQPHTGTFILTSVLSQAPILGGEWLFAQLSPAVKIVPPESIVPNNSTPQQIARQGYQQLDQSEITAIVEGLRLAGYPAETVGKGVVVQSIQPDSPASEVLQPGDVIHSINGSPVRITSDLIDLVKRQDPHSTVQLQVERDQKDLSLALPLMTPASPGGSPRIGITIESAGFDTRLPFPVKINPEKIVGGPSAGLMFTLTVLNSLSPQDLTGGRRIAGTGTINPDGTVGPIGGVQMKVVAAEAAGATYFLSPVENYADALSAARHIQVVKIATVDQAVAFLHSLPPLPASK
jgi:PDZ domain-containing protein